MICQVNLVAKSADLPLFPSEELPLVIAQVNSVHSLNLLEVASAKLVINPKIIQQILTQVKTVSKLLHRLVRLELMLILKASVLRLHHRWKKSVIPSALMETEVLLLKELVLVNATRLMM